MTTMTDQHDSERLVMVVQPSGVGVDQNLGPSSSSSGERAKTMSKARSKMFVCFISVAAILGGMNRFVRDEPTLGNSGVVTTSLRKGGADGSGNGRLTSIREEYGNHHPADHVNVHMEELLRNNTMMKQEIGTRKKRLDGMNKILRTASSSGVTEKALSLKDNASEEGEDDEQVTNAATSTTKTSASMDDPAGSNHKRKEEKVILKSTASNVSSAAESAPPSASPSKRLVPNVTQMAPLSQPTHAKPEGSSPVGNRTSSVAPPSASSSKLPSPNATQAAPSPQATHTKPEGSSPPSSKHASSVAPPSASSSKKLAPGIKPIAPSPQPNHIKLGRSTPASKQTSSSAAMLLPPELVNPNIVIGGKSFSLDGFEHDNSTSEAAAGVVAEARELHSLLPLPKPIIVVGMPKTGTSSISDFFKKSGSMRTIHWRKDKYSERVGNCMKRAYEEGKPLLKTCGNYDAWAQIDVTDSHLPKNESSCYYPQITNLQELHQEAPNATFILNRRNYTAWASSVHRWGTLANRLVACKPFGPTSNTTNDLIDWHMEHIQRIRQFVLDHPSHALVEVDIQDPDAGQLMSKAFGIDEKHWGQSNTNTGHLKIP